MNFSLLTQWIIRFLLPVAVGAAVSLGCHIFLVGLNVLTAFRTGHPEIIFLLPAAGVFLVWCKKKWGSQHFRSTEYIKSQSQQGYRFLPSGIGFTGLFGTWLTHLFGGSAGRESTAVQIGASISDHISAKLQLSNEYRLRLMLAGISAAFGAAVGAPWASLVFGIEWTDSLKNRRPYFEIICAVVSAYWCSVYLKTPHMHFRKFTSLPYDDQSIKAVLILALLSALLAFVMRVTSFHIVQFFFRKKINDYAQILMGSFVLIFLYRIFGTDYAGLGLEKIYLVAQERTPINDAFIKGLTTSVTLSTGFMGGEFVPSVFMGTHLASSLSEWMLPANVSLFPLGFVTVFTALFGAPLTAVLIAVELFGFEWWFYGLIACGTTHLSMKYLLTKFISQNILQSKNKE